MNSRAAFGCGAFLKIAPVSGQIGVASTVGEMRGHRLAFLFHRFGDVEDRIDGNDVSAGGDAALLAEMTLDEVRLVEHVLVHPVPAVFPHYVMEQPERGVVVRRIGRHRLAAELRLEKIKRGVRYVG